MRPGSEINRVAAAQASASRFIHGDMRSASDFDALPAGRLGDRRRRQSQRAGRARRATSAAASCSNTTWPASSTCWNTAKAHRAGLLLLQQQPRLFHRRAERAAARAPGNALSRWTPRADLPAGSPRAASAVDFSTRAPVSLYGGTKLASRSAGPGIRRGLRLPGVDRPLRRAGRRRTVRHARAGHLRLLDQRPSPPPAAALHRLRWRRQAGPRLLSSARPGRAAGSRRCGSERAGGQRIYTAGGGRPTPCRWRN